MSKNAASTRDDAPDEGETLSISEAAKRYGVSVRTVQRRLDAGTWEAVFKGATRRVRARNTTRHDDAPEGDTMARHNATDDAPNPLIRSATPRQRDAPEATSDATQRDQEGDMTRHLIAEKDARIADLQATVAAQRAQIEGANRQAAESAAALREYLKIQSKALPSREYSQSENRAETPPETEKSRGVSSAPDAKQGAQADAKRKLAPWQQIIARTFGIR